MTLFVSNDYLRYYIFFLGQFGGGVETSLRFFQRNKAMFLNAFCPLIDDYTTVYI